MMSIIRISAVEFTQNFQFLKASFVPIRDEKKTKGDIKKMLTERTMIILLSGEQNACVIIANSQELEDVAEVSESR